MSNSIEPLDGQKEKINARNKNAQKSNGNRALVFSIIRTLLIFAAFIIIFNILFAFRTVHENDMFPSLKDGDLTLVSKISGYTKNDVVFYETDEELKIGRIIAKGDDIVDITENGEVLVNGTNRQGEIVYKTYPPENWSGPVTVPKDAVFILGDNRVSGSDSRIYGFIELSRLQGKVIAMIRHNGM